VPRRSGRASSASAGDGQDDFRTVLFHAISHDLKTPLTVIAGSLSTLLRRDVALDDAARRELVETAYASVQRLTGLLDNLLRMAKLEANMLELRLEPYHIEEVIGTAIAQLGPFLEKRRFQVHLPPDFPIVSFDFALVAQVLINVLDNAIKYSSTEALIEVWARQTPGHFILSVGDRGIGIPAEERDRVFDKFHRVTRELNSAVPGAGLGLAIAKGFVEAHGGRIWAEGRDGGGTIVTVSIPLQ
jgi:two-component system, OmpR family, sensor histidine kinase KdpD